jgi:hypothetical protein
MRCNVSYFRGIYLEVFRKKNTKVFGQDKHVSDARFEPPPPRIRSRSANHSAATSRLIIYKYKFKIAVAYYLQFSENKTSDSSVKKLRLSDVFLRSRSPQKPEGKRAVVSFRVSRINFLTFKWISFYLKVHKRTVQKQVHASLLRVDEKLLSEFRKRGTRANVRGGMARRVCCCQ